MQHLKKNDRVACYIGGTIDQRDVRVVGTVLEVREDRLHILVDKGKPSEASWWVHRKQCRKLKSKIPLGSKLFISEDMISFREYQIVKT